MPNLLLSLTSSLVIVGLAATSSTSLTAQESPPDFPRGLVFDLVVTRSTWDKDVGLTIETTVSGRPPTGGITFHFPAHHTDSGKDRPKGVVNIHAVSIRPGAQGAGELDSAFRTHFKLQKDQTLFLENGRYLALTALTLDEIASQGGNLLIEAAPVPGKLDYRHRFIYDKTAGTVQFRLYVSKAFVLPKPDKPPQ